MPESKIKIGKNCKISKNSTVGEKPRDKSIDFLEIGDNATIRSGTVIYLGSKIGKNLQTGHNALIREKNILGDSVRVGTNSALEPENKIGNNVTIRHGVFLEQCRIGSNVFIGPNVVFTDDLHPHCPSWDKCLGGAIIEDNVSIGANTTILPGVKIGKNSLIGAGSVVAKDIPANSVALGNPARVVKKISELSCVKGIYKKPYTWLEEKVPGPRVKE